MLDVVAQMLGVAEIIDKLQAVCLVCGMAATRSQRIADSHERVLVGGEGAYEARCRRHWQPEPLFAAVRRQEGTE